MIQQDASLPAPWDFYRLRSLEAQAARCDDVGRGREEQLCETLDVIRKGLPLDQATRDRLERLPWNRAKKYRRLRRHLAQKFEPARHSGDMQFEAVDIADLVAAVRKLLRPEQWEIEYQLASGATFAEVAPEYGVSPGTLKVRVKRWRDKIRTCIL